MANLKERSNWIITYVVKNRDLSNKKIGEALGWGEETVGAYRNMGADPKLKFIIAFCDAYEIDFLWFSKGEGEPFPGAREQFPEVCGEPLIYKDRKPGTTGPYQVTDKDGLWGETRDSIVEGKKVPVTLFSPDQEAPPDGRYDFGRASNGLREIYDSQDPVLIPAIEANIRAFRLSAQRERQNHQQAQEINRLIDICDELRNRVDTLEEAITEIKKGQAA